MSILFRHSLVLRWRPYQFHDSIKSRYMHTFVALIKFACNEIVSQTCPLLHAHFARRPPPPRDVRVTREFQNCGSRTSWSIISHQEGHHNILFYILIGVVWLAIGFTSTMSKLVRCYPLHQSVTVRSLAKRCDAIPYPPSAVSLYPV